jgi:hypothetical protein
MADKNRLLELAIRGLKHELAELESELAGAARTYAKAVAPALVGTRKRRRMSAAARRAISVAQKARWAKHAKASTKAAPKKTRRVSAAARRAAAERMREYWAKRRAATK